jgi:hypothetical protein
MDNVRADESVVQEKIQALRKLLTSSANIAVITNRRILSSFDCSETAFFFLEATLIFR